MTALLSRQSASLRAELTLRMTELTTGLHKDLGKAVGGDFSALNAVEHSLARLKGYQANTTEAALFTEVQQTALGVIWEGAVDLGADILSSTGQASQTGITSLAIEAGRTFETAVAALNTRFSERAVFSGVASDSSPLPNAETILAALDAEIAGALTVADVQTAIADWFDDPAGYDALYAGGAARADVQISADESVPLAITATDPAIKDTLRGLATAAMLDRGALAGQHDARAQLMQAAADDLLTTGEARSQVMARLGTVQSQIAAAQTRNGAEESALEITRAGIVTADPYDTATRLEDLQSRLESLYLVTSRVSRLSLADYI
jgi:flagellar hook-associated protein 3 FlgL